MSLVPPALHPKEIDIKQLLACNSHLGEQNVTSQMERYCWKRRADGIHIINLAKTWEKLILAARIFVTVENPADVAVISGPQIGQRAVLKFAQYTGATHLSGRFTPGTFTNQIQEKFFEPRLLIVTDTRVDHQAISESSYVNLPTIALCSTDARPKFVDVVIPCNNKTTESTGLIFWMLAREILFLRKEIDRTRAWDVMVDIFFLRPAEEVEDKKALEDGYGEDQFRAIDTGGIGTPIEPSYGGATWGEAGGDRRGAAPSQSPWSDTTDSHPSTTPQPLGWGDTPTGDVNLAPVWGDTPSAPSEDLIPR